VRWLLTVPVGVDTDRLAAVVTSAGGSLRDDPPIPLDDDELVIFADGPRDLPSRLAEHDVPVHKVSPDSDFELY
jgi:hypothetical protein